MKTKRFRKLHCVLLVFVCVCVGALAVFFVLGTDNTLHVMHYEIKSEKISTPICFALLTDLHSGKFGENQSELLDVIKLQNPDAVFFVGDIFDERFPNDNAFLTLGECAKKFPTFYVTGNHEYKSYKGKRQNANELKRLTENLGVIVLAGDYETMIFDAYDEIEIDAEHEVDKTKNIVDTTTVVNIYGIDDPLFIGQQAMREQLSNAIAKTGDDVKTNAKEAFNILLAHRPELLDIYSEYGFDLVLSGHAHGGQWSVPGLIDGLYSPSQGIFPKYTSGKYFSGKTTLVLSRGLGRNATIIPRLFNPVEIVLVDLIPLQDS